MTGWNIKKHKTAVRAALAVLLVLALLQSALPVLAEQELTRSLLRQGRFHHDRGLRHAARLGRVDAILRLVDKGVMRAKNDVGGGSTEDIDNIRSRFEEEKKAEE